jgi:hypothetical protein
MNIRNNRLFAFRAAAFSFSESSDSLGLSLGGILSVYIDVVP